MYGNYSRRGLIQMNESYDEHSDGALKKFVEETDQEFEKVRPIEQIIEQADKAVDTLGEMTGAIPKNIADKISSTVADFVNDVRSELEAVDTVADDQPSEA